MSRGESGTATRDANGAEDRPAAARLDSELVLVARLPPSFARAHLARLGRHVAVLSQVDPYDPSARASMLLFDGKRLIDENPIALPSEASGVVSIAGDWPDAIDLVAVGRENVGEATLNTFGLERTGAGWRVRDVGAQVVTIGARTVSVSRGAQASSPFRSIRGAPLTPWNPTSSRAAGCPSDDRPFALAPVQLAPFGTDGLAVLGTACEGSPAVELFTSGRETGDLQMFASNRGEFGSDVAQGQLLSRGNALWLVSFRSLFRYAGASWQLIAPPSPLGNITDGALGSDGSLWLCDRGKLLRRDDDGSYREVAAFDKGPMVTEIEPAPGGGFLLLADDGLYKLEGRGW